LCTKFGYSGLRHSRDMGVALKSENESCDPDYVLLGVGCHAYISTRHSLLVYKLDSAVPDF